MRKTVLFTLLAAVLLCAGGCSPEKKKKDRGEANEMFERICKLTEDYTKRLENAPDSADWASLCSEFEEKLDKITFSYPPDTDLLLTEGQNDTIHLLMDKYVNVRKGRINGILHPVVAADSIPASDSIHEVAALAPETNQ